jgi:hypothetical protein
MCQTITDFTLCSCADKKTTNPSEYFWYILRYIQTNDTHEMGRVISPKESLDHGLNQEMVLIKLNQKNCFDFEYEPQEKDCLHLAQGKKYSGDYMAFTYRNGEWVNGKEYDPFSDEMKEVKAGKLKNC